MRKVGLIIGAIVVLLGVGYFVKNYDFSKKTYSPASKQTAQDSNSAMTNAIKSGDYFIIPELEIKLKVGTDLQNLSYVFQENTSPGYEFRGVNLTSAELLAQDRGCAAGALGSLGKTKHDPLNSESSDMPDERYVKKIGEYYYYYIGSLDTCSDKEEVNTLQAEQIDLIKAAFQTIETL